MKKLILCFTFLSASAAYAQSVIPQVEQIPVTGFEQLRNENPYILVERSFDGGEPFTPEVRYIKTPSNVPGFYKRNIESRWENGAWSDLQLFQDTFMLDGQGRLHITIEDQAYNYPGFESRTKVRCLFSYNAQSKPEAIKVQNAVPATSNNFTDAYTWKLHYNSAGVRDFDTMVYPGTTEMYAYEYKYNSAGRLSQMIGYRVEDGAVDSAQVTVYSYNPEGRLNKFEARYYDFDEGEWIDSQKDSMEYDAQGRISKRVNFVTFSIDGVRSFGPYLNESYKYDANGKLEEIAGASFNPVLQQWANYQKHTILYDNGKAKLGFIYLADQNGTWSTTPDQRLLFTEPVTGVREQRNDILSAVYPVPAHKELFIELKSAVHHEVHMYDMNGREMNITVEVSGAKLRLDVSALHAGIYLLKVNNGSSYTSERIVIGQ